MRYLAINYHRGAYLNRIRNAIFVEYIFSKLIHYLEYAELILREGPSDAKPSDEHEHEITSIRPPSSFATRIKDRLQWIRSSSGKSENRGVAASLYSRDETASVYGRMKNSVMSIFTPSRLNLNQQPNQPFSISQAYSEFSSNSIYIGSQKISEKDLISGEYTTYQLSDLIEYLKRNVTLKCYAPSLKILQSQALEHNESVPLRDSLRKIGAVIFERLVHLRNHRVDAGQSQTPMKTPTSVDMSMVMEEDVIAEEDFEPLFGK